MSVPFLPFTLFLVPFTRHSLLFTDSYLLFIHQWIFNQDALDDLSVIQVFRDYFLRLQPKGSSNDQRIPKRELCTTNTLRHSLYVKKQAPFLRKGDDICSFKNYRV